MLKLVTTNANPVCAEDMVRALVRAEIARSKKPRLTTLMVAEVILLKSGADMGALVTHAARLYLKSLARQELPRSPRQAIDERPVGSS